jgi:hypothetical protein
MKVIEFPQPLSLTEAIHRARDLLDDFKCEKITEYECKTIMKELYQARKLAQLVPRMVRWTKLNGYALVRLGFIDEKTLEFYQRKRNILQLQDQISVLSAVLKEASLQLYKK